MLCLRPMRSHCSIRGKRSNRRRREKKKNVVAAGFEPAPSRTTIPNNSPGLDERPERSALDRSAMLPDALVTFPSTYHGGCQNSISTCVQAAQNTFEGIPSYGNRDQSTHVYGDSNWSTSSHASCTPAGSDRLAHRSLVPCSWLGSLDRSAPDNTCIRPS